MALIDKASLLMVPSTYEAGKLYNVLPSGNRAPDSTDQNSGYDQTRADFDFDRGSNASATRIGSDGLIKKYRENLLVQSNQFDTTWYNSNSTETGGQADKDGGTSAWLLTKTSTNGGIRQNNTTSGVQTFSFYAKAGESNWVKVNNLGSSAYHQANFDLQNGVVGTTAYIIDAKIEDIGNGWYRCVTTYNTTLVNIDIRVADSDNVVSGSSGSVYIQSAQLETGLVASSYLDSTSVTGKAGVLVDLPRINYDANGENGALLLEPSRGNSFPHSEPFSGSGQTASVGGYLIGDAFGIGVYGGVQLNAGSTHYYYGFSSAASTQYAVSFFVRRTDGGAPRLGTGSGDVNGDFCFVASGDVYSPNDWDTTPTITLFKDDIYKFEGVLTTPAVVDNFGPLKYSSNSAINVQITGLQAEPNASYASSYIPCMGTSETRAADSCYNLDGMASIIGQTEGTIFCEFTLLSNENTDHRLSISSGASVDWIFVSIPEDGINTRMYVRINGVAVIDINSNQFTKGNTYKIAFAYKSGDSAIYINGSSKVTSSTAFGSPSVTLDTFGISGSNAGSSTPQNLSNSIKQTALFKERLSNAELATLTTL